MSATNWFALAFLLALAAAGAAFVGTVGAWFRRATLGDKWRKYRKVALGAAAAAFASMIGGVLTQVPATNQTASLAHAQRPNIVATPKKHAVARDLIVSVAASASLNHGIVDVTGTTNLPDQTELLVSLERGDYSGQVKAVVAGGKFRAAGFQNGNGPLVPGRYTVDINSGVGDIQPDAVRAIIGQHGQKMHGPLVQNADDPFKGSKLVESVTKLILRDAAPPAHGATPAKEDANDPARVLDNVKPDELAYLDMPDRPLPTGKSFRLARTVPVLVYNDNRPRVDFDSVFHGFKGDRFTVLKHATCCDTNQLYYYVELKGRRGWIDGQALMWQKLKIAK